MVNKKQFNHLDKANGWTLIELMLVVTIIAVIALSGPELLLQTYSFFQVNSAQREMQQDSRMIMDRLTRNLRQAQPNTITIDNASGQPSYSRISFSRMQGESITYYQSGRNLNQVVNGRISTLTDDIRYLVFAIPHTDEISLISISLTLEKEVLKRRRKALHMASEKVRIMN